MKRKLEDDDLETITKRQRQDPNLDPDLLSHDTTTGDDKSSLCSATERSSFSNALLTETAPTPLTAGSPNPHTRRRFPSDLKTIKCPNCPKTFNRPARLAAHLRSHTNDRAFKCTFPGCTKDYLEEKHLKQHIKGSHTQERRYTCEEPGCDKAFVTATRLRRHAAVHEGAERYRCRGYGSCSQTFRKHQTLQRHIRTEHLGQAAYPCPQDGCSAGFDTAGALKRHADRNHGELRFWCDECGRQPQTETREEGDDATTRVGFTTMALLQAHMRREHVDCMFCAVRCGSQAQLERHIELHHSGSTIEDRKTIPCSYPSCPKTFTRRNNLNAHVRTAHEGYRFVCGEVDTFSTEDIADWNWLEEGCGEGFISKMKLEEHVRFVHLGRKRPPKPYTVQAGTSDLVESLAGVIDDTKRNIPCSVEGCLLRFIRYHDLRAHLRQGHNSSLSDDAQDCQVVEGRADPSQGLVSPGVPPRQPGPGDIESIAPEPYGTPYDAYGEEGEFWFAAGGPHGHGDEEAMAEFEREWSDMRRLIDVDALVDGPEA